ncbi:MAG: hypothetical protein RJA22_1804 [Verrucomicrobiota bacterium]
MKHCAALLGALTVALSSTPFLSAQAQAAPAAGKPSIRFSETSFDFGKVKPTDPQKHVFIITNVGTAELEITEVKPGCGCTTAGEWDKKIAPGKTGVIPIGFNPASFSGTVGKSVSITCNDPAAPTHILSIQATIWRPLDIVPQYTHFLPVEGETNAEVRVVRITNNTEDNIQVEAPESTNPQFKPSLKEVRPGKEWELTVTYAGPISNTPPNGMINLKSTAAGTPQLSVSAYAMPQPAVSAMPPQVQLPPAPLPPSYSYPVAIRNNGSQPFNVSEAKVNADGVTARIQEATPGKLFNVVLTFSADFKLPAGQAVELSAKTSHPKYPLIRVPIIQNPPTIAPATFTPPSATPITIKPGSAAK